LKEVSAVPQKLPDRMDWEFTFADTVNYSLKEGEARIAVFIAGEEVVDVYRYIHVPEEWKRNERNQLNMLNTAQIVSGLVIFLIFIAGIVKSIVNWTRKQFSIPTFVTFFSILFVVGALTAVNNWHSMMADFSTSEPLSNQIFTTVGFRLIWLLFLSAGATILMGFIKEWKPQQVKNNYILFGICAGLCMSGLMAVTSVLFEPSLQPQWAQYQTIDDMIPILGVALAPLMKYIIETIFLLLLFTVFDRLTDQWTNSRVKFSIIFILVILAIIGTLANSFSYWLIGGLIIAFAALFIYIYVFRFQLELIPIFTGAIAILNEFKQGLLTAYPNSVLAHFFAVILIILLSQFWYKQLKN